MEDEIIREKYVMESEKLDSLAVWIPRSARHFIPLIKKILRFFEEFLGIKFFFQIPSGFAAIPAEAWEILELASHLKTTQIISFITKEQGGSSEEIPIVRYKIKMAAGSDFLGDAHGYDISSDKEALWKALQSALKLYSLHKFYPKEGSYKIEPLGKMAEPHLNPESLAGISDEERKKENPMFKISFSKETEFRWIKGFLLRDKSSIWIPFQLVNINFQKTHRDESLLRLAGTAGIGVSKDKYQAILEGLLDLIEKDACMIAWINELTPPRLDPSTLKNEKITTILNELEEKKLETHLLALPTDLPIYVVLALAIDKSGNGPAVSASSGAAFNIEGAVQSALLRVLAIRGSSIKKKIQKEFKMTRQSNIFFQTRLENFSNIGRRGRIFLWARRKMIKRVGFLLEGKVKKSSEFPDFLRKDSYKEQVNFLSEKMKEVGLEIMYVNSTPKKITDTEIKIISVIVPGLQPMHSEESLPYISGRRLSEVPAKLGYPALREINRLPHPFYTI